MSSCCSSLLTFLWLNVRFDLLCSIVADLSKCSSTFKWWISILVALCLFLSFRVFVFCSTKGIKELWMAKRRFQAEKETQMTDIGSRRAMFSGKTMKCAPFLWKMFCQNEEIRIVICRPFRVVEELYTPRSRDGWKTGHKTASTRTDIYGLLTGRFNLVFDLRVSIFERFLVPKLAVNGVHFERPGMRRCSQWSSFFYSPYRWDLWRIEGSYPFNAHR